VPQQYKEDLKLGDWVKRQRENFKNSKIDPEQKRMLDEIGFELNVKDKMNEERWNCQFQKLRDYYDKHGHCELFWTFGRFVPSS
jgi:hypothetical protein